MEKTTVNCSPNVNHLLKKFMLCTIFSIGEDKSGASDKLVNIIYCTS